MRAEELTFERPTAVLSFQGVNGDIQKAMDFLREKGIATAAKRSGKTAGEGLVGVGVSECRTQAVMVGKYSRKYTFC